MLTAERIEEHELIKNYVFTEGEKIIAPSSEEGRLFQSHCERVLNRIRPDIDLNNNPIIFLIADVPYKNAFYAENKDLPVVVFSKPLLRSFKTEDQFAYIMGHEFNHHALIERWGTGPNSNVEEGLSDTWPLIWMHDAGYDTREALNFVRDYAKETAKKWNILWVRDVHLLPDFREETVEKSVAAIHHKTGKVEDKTPTALPSDFENIAKKRHVPYIEKRLLEKGFMREADVAKKIDILIELTSELDEFVAQRRNVFKNAVKNLKVNRAKPEHVAKLKELSDLLVEKAANYNTIAPAIAAHIGEYIPAKLEPIKEAIASFVSAEDFIDIKQQASHLMEVINASGLDLSNTNLSQLNAANFSLPSEDELKEIAGINEEEEDAYDGLDKVLMSDAYTSLEHTGDDEENEIDEADFEREEPSDVSIELEPIQLPWNKHLEAAGTELSSGKIGSDIWHALYFLGVREDRLIDIAPLHILENLDKAVTSNTQFPGAQMETLDLFDGHIIGIKVNEEGSLLEIRKDPTENILTPAERFEAYKDVVITKKKQEGAANTRLAYDKLLSLPPLEVSADTITSEFEQIFDDNILIIQSFNKTYKDLTGREIPSSVLTMHQENLVIAKQPEDMTEDEEIDYEIMMRSDLVDKIIDVDDEKDTEFIRLAKQKQLQSAKALTSAFEQLLQSGDDSDIDFIRSFYLGREDERDVRVIADSDIGMDRLETSHPYITFLTKHKNLFSNNERARIAASIANINLLYKTKNFWANLFFLNPATTFESLRENLSVYKSSTDHLHKLLHDSDFAKEHSFLAMMAGMDSDTDFDITKNIYESGAQEIFEYIKNNGFNLEPGQMSELLTQFPKFIPDLKGIFSKEETSENEQNIDLTELLKQESVWPEDIDSLIAMYKVVEENTLYPSNAWQNRLISKLTKAFKQLSDPNDIIEACEKLGFSRTPQDVKVRNLVIDQWVKSQKAILGKEEDADNSEEFFAKIQPVLETVKEVRDYSLRYELMVKLTDELVTQEKLSFYIRDNILIDDSRKSAIAQDINIKPAQLAINIARSNDQRRKLILDFLSEKYTEKSSAVFAQEFYRDANEYLRGLDLRIPQETDEKKRWANVQAKRLHENFWNAPLALRASMIDSILLKGEEKRADREQQDNTYFNKAFNSVVERVLPANQKYAEQSRKILWHYSQILPDYQRGVFIASMMSAGQKADRASDANNVGTRLAFLLEMMGPAEKKLGQRIHSYHDTPADIKDGMGKLKYAADVLPRWELWDLFNQRAPHEVKEDAYIGPIKGAASYYVTADFGEDNVVRLLRDHAISQADRGFKDLEKLVDVLKDEDDTLAEIVAPLSDMIKQAKDSIEAETSSAFGYKQNEESRKLNNNWQISVNGQKFKFKTADWLSYGPGFSIQQKMLGKHFNEVAAKTETQKTKKKNLAIAVVTKEFMNILSGKSFDEDCHGAQLRYDGRSGLVGKFDPGGYQLKEVSEEELSALGNILGDCITGAMAGQNILSIFTKQLNELRKENGTIPDYFIRVETALLQLGDFLSELNKEDMISIFSTLFAQGYIHKNVTQSIISKAPGLTMIAQAGMPSFGTNIAISKPKANDTPPKPIVYGNLAMV